MLPGVLHTMHLRLRESTAGGHCPVSAQAEARPTREVAGEVLLPKEGGRVGIWTEARCKDERKGEPKAGNKAMNQPPPPGNCPEEFDLFSFPLDSEMFTLSTPLKCFSPLGQFSQVSTALP